MEKLLKFFNSLSAQDRLDFMACVETTENYIRKAVSAKQLLSPKLCVQIEQATDGAVTRRDLRPDDWAQIWPELKGDQ